MASVHGSVQLCALRYVIIPLFVLFVSNLPLLMQSYYSHVHYEPVHSAHQ